MLAGGTRQNLVLANSSSSHAFSDHSPNAPCPCCCPVPRLLLLSCPCLLPTQNRAFRLTTRDPSTVSLVGTLFAVQSVTSFTPGRSRKGSSACFRSGCITRPTNDRRCMSRAAYPRFTTGLRATSTTGGSRISRCNLGVAAQTYRRVSSKCSHEDRSGGRGRLATAQTEAWGGAQGQGRALTLHTRN
eukprot:scaffold3768_cov376-Prasinococcus_capsulatus_cf.AAC.17